uniref:Uncharacterized protein n=1 Tax=Rhizophora mucronata TaxID=61149 RepID=A0A2P2PYE8_RHIMU
MQFLMDSVYHWLLLSTAVFLVCELFLCFSFLIGVFGNKVMWKTV